MTAISPHRVRLALFLLVAAALCQIPARLLADRLATIDGASPEQAIRFYLCQALAVFATVVALLALPLLRQRPLKDLLWSIVIGMLATIFLLAAVNALYTYLYAAYAIHRISQHDLGPYFHAVGSGLLGGSFHPSLMQLTAFPLALLTFLRLDQLADTRRAHVLRLLTLLVFVAAILLLILNIEYPRDFQTLAHQRFGLPSPLDNGHPLSALYPTTFYLLFALAYCPLAALRLSPKPPPCLLPPPLPTNH